MNTYIFYFKVSENMDGKFYTNDVTYPSVRH